MAAPTDSQQHEDLPFRAEYAKSSRSSCRGCRMGIDKDTLRLAVMVQSPNFDGKIPNWYHFTCFFKKTRVTTEGDITGFASLRWEDQEKVKGKITSGGGASGSSKAASIEYCVEYAKSNRSSCVGCEDKIEKGIVRISKKDFTDQRYGQPMDRWFHVDCFVKDMPTLGFTGTADKIYGFGKMKKDDQKMLVSTFGKPSKKRKKEAAIAPNGDTKKMKAEASASDAHTVDLQAQSKFLWEIRDKLGGNVTNKILKELLTVNKQEIPSGESKLLDLITDCLAFGALEPCTECNGQLVYKADAYYCTGFVSGWTKCILKTTHPKRRPFQIPEEYHEIDIFKKYKYKKRTRIFPKIAESSVAKITRENSTALLDKPLHNMYFALVGTKKLSKTKAELQAAIEKLGGTLVSDITTRIAAVISCKEELQAKSRKLLHAEVQGIHIVSEDFLDAVKDGKAAEMIKKHSIAPWGSDPQVRIDNAASKIISKSIGYSINKSELAYKKGVPSKMKLTVKSGAAVDPDSELDEVAHVYKAGKDLFTATLGLVDVANGTNSFYKLQMLEADGRSRYWVFRSWGRVGTTIGDNRLEKFSKLEHAQENFLSLYRDKTGNEWEDRENFVKHPRKFYPLEIDYGEDEVDSKALKTTSTSSKLHTSVQELVRMIFDVDAMKKTMLEMEIDLTKMPLGKLTKRHIESAYTVLTEAQGLVEDEGTRASQSQYLDVSNRFYTLVPHDFGMKKPPLLDNADIIKSKLEMLDSLMDMEIAYNLLKSEGASDKDPLDLHYEKLKTDIQPLEKSSSEFEMLEKYVKNTHGATHTSYSLELDEVFKIARQGESKRFKPFKKLHNRTLLWHGSRTMNYGGILSQGLRIAPPEAPVTGYMFGKGIYFADMVSKSANYCHTYCNSSGLLLLCDVALGDMYELEKAKTITKLPSGTHSCKGIGRYHPDPSNGKKMDDGVHVPLGEGIDSGRTTSDLLYNEFIVYDVAQVNIKYLLKLNFEYTSLW